MEFEFWEKFSHCDDAGDDFELNQKELDEITSLHSSGEIESCDHKQRRLKNLYGLRTDHDEFSVIACSRCARVLKPSDLSEHFRTRHSGTDLLMDEVKWPMMMPIQYFSKKPAKAFSPVELETKKPKTKRRKIDHSLKFESHPPRFPPEVVKRPQKLTTIAKSHSQSFLLPQYHPKPEDQIEYSQSFTLPHQLKRSTAHQPNVIAPLKMKFKNIGCGLWRVKEN